MLLSYDTSTLFLKLGHNLFCEHCRRDEKNGWRGLLWEFYVIYLSRFQWENEVTVKRPLLLSCFYYAISLHARSHMHTQRAWWQQPLGLPSKIYLHPQYCLHSKGHEFDISTHPFPVCDIKDCIVSIFNMQFIICTFTTSKQVVLNSVFGDVVRGKKTFCKMLVWVNECKGTTAILLAVSGIVASNSRWAAREPSEQTKWSRPVRSHGVVCDRTQMRRVFPESRLCWGCQRWLKQKVSLGATIFVLFRVKIACRLVNYHVTESQQV